MATSNETVAKKSDQRARAPASIKSLDDATMYLESHQGHLTVMMFIEDWSENCASTYNMLVEQLNDPEVSQNVAFCEVIAESHPEVCQKYNIVGVPTVLFFRKMKEIDRISGVRVREVSTKLKFHTLNNVLSSTLAMGEACGEDMSETNELNQRLKQLINEHPVMVFIKGTPMEPKCGFSRTIISILNESGVAYGSFNILLDDDVRQGLKIFSRWQTYPQLYIRGELIGGLDIVKEMKENGDLLSALKGESS